MVLLRFRYDLSERNLVKRCRRDLGFRYALGLEDGEDPPSQRTLGRFQDHLIEVKREGG